MTSSTNEQSSTLLICSEIVSDIVDAVAEFGECEMRAELFTFNTKEEVIPTPTLSSPLLVYHSPLPRSDADHLDETFQGAFQHKPLLLSRLPKHKILSELDTDYHMVHIYQCKVVRQRTNAVCGYHALFNSIQALRVLQSSSDKEQEYHIGHMMDRTCFWFFYIRVQALFRRYAQLQQREYYPWSSKNIDMGLFEREYMKYVLEKETAQIEKIGRHKFTSIPDLSPRSLKNGILATSQIRTIQKVFDRFIEAGPDSDIYHAFVLGSGNHWFSFVVHQHKSQTETRIEGLYLDSRNNPIFGQTDDQLRQQVTNRLTSHQARAVVKFTAFQQEYYTYNYFESLKDTQFSINLILDCIKGKKNFLTECINLMADDMLSRFKEEVQDKLIQQPSAYYLIMTWSVNYFQPQFIYDSLIVFIRDFGSDLVDGEIRRQLLELSQFILNETSEEKELLYKNESGGDVVGDSESLRHVMLKLQKSL